MYKTFSFHNKTTSKKSIVLLHICYQKESRSPTLATSHRIDNRKTSGKHVAEF